MNNNYDCLQKVRELLDSMQIVACKNLLYYLGIPKNVGNPIKVDFGFTVA